ncbi:MAG: CatA-like O-acetyltransferase, family 2 [Lepagella sp.]
MKREVYPADSGRSEAFRLWMTSPMPMVTLVKTIDISRLVRYSRKHQQSINMLLCWCIGKAASGISEFYTLPEGDRLYEYDRLAINVIVNNERRGINSCDIPYNEDIRQFASDYHRLTREASQECRSSFLDGYMVIGTSAMIETELDCIVNQYTDKFFNPMVMWGKYRKKWLRTTLPISFQFHHVQMDGGHGARFLEAIQQEIDTLGR